MAQVACFDCHFLPCNMLPSSTNGRKSGVQLRLSVAWSSSGVLPWWLSIEQHQLNAILGTKIQAKHASKTSKPFDFCVWPLLCCRSSGPSFSRPQSLLTTRSHLKAIPSGPVLLNNVASPQSTHGHHSSSRDFFSQPSPGAILANGAPAGLQKAIVELMRRQSDTVKWEQKSSRACEHRSGVASHRLSDAVLL